MQKSLLDITVEELYVAASGVWAQMLQMPLLPGPPTRDHMPAVQHYRARIELDDHEHYALYAVCDKAMLDAAAQRMFGLPLHELDDGLRQDALGELVNIVAAELSKGNLEVVQQGLPVFSAGAPARGLRQHLLCALEAHCGTDHIYLALCSYRVQANGLMPEAESDAQSNAGERT